MSHFVSIHGILLDFSPILTQRAYCLTYGSERSCCYNFFSHIFFFHKVYMVCLSESLSKKDNLKLKKKLNSLQ